MSVSEVASRTDEDPTPTAYTDAMGVLLDQVVEAIRDAEAKGYTRYRLAKDTGLSQAALSHIVNGERDTITLDTLERICEALGLSVKIEKPGKRKVTSGNS